MSMAKWGGCWCARAEDRQGRAACPDARPGRGAAWVAKPASPNESRVARTAAARPLLSARSG
eukprot:2043649-Pyramimonas_sp.AAC.1